MARSVPRATVASKGVLPMRHRIVCCFAAALTAPLALCGSAFAQCSLNTVRGAWAFQSQGTVMMVAPGASLPLPGAVRIPGVMSGRTARETTPPTRRSPSADRSRRLSPGAIEVNPDCTAAATGLARRRSPLGDPGQRQRDASDGHQPPPGAVDGHRRFRRIARGEPAVHEPDGARRVRPAAGRERT